MHSANSVTTVNNKATGYGSIEHEPTKVSGSKAWRAIGWVALLVLGWAVGYFSANLASPSQGSDLLPAHQYAIHSAEGNAAIVLDADSSTDHTVAVEICFDREAVYVDGGYYVATATYMFSVDGNPVDSVSDTDTLWADSLIEDIQAGVNCQACTNWCIWMQGSDSVEGCLNLCWESTDLSRLCDPESSSMCPTPSPTEQPISTSTPWPSKALEE